MRDILWALCGPEAYSLLVTRGGWTAQDFREWLYGALVEQLLQRRFSRAGARSG